MTDSATGREERTATTGWDKFATYKRDAHSGLDYEDQRYYSSVHERFLTADPYVASARAHSDYWRFGCSRGFGCGLAD